MIAALSMAGALVGSGVVMLVLATWLGETEHALRMAHRADMARRAQLGAIVGIVTSALMIVLGLAVIGRAVS